MKTDTPIVFRCPHCQVSLGAPLEAAGKTAKCPRCEKTVKVPDHSKA